MGLLAPRARSALAFKVRRDTFVFGESGDYYDPFKFNISIRLTDMRKQFSAQPLSMRVHAGNRTELICGAPKAYPAPIVEWLHNNVSVRNDSLAVLLTGNGSLVISGATVQVNGGTRIICLGLYN